MRSKVFVLLVLGFVVCSSDVRGMPAPGLSLESVSSSGKTSVFSTVATAVEHAGTFAWIYTAGRALAKGTFLKPSKKEEYMQSRLQKFLLSPQIAFIATVPTAITCIPSLSPYMSSFVAGALPAAVLAVQGLYDIYKIANWGAKKLHLSWHYKVLNRFWIGVGRKEGTGRQKDECEMFVNKLCAEKWPDMELIDVAVSEVNGLSDSSTQQDLKGRLSDLLRKIEGDVLQMLKVLQSPISETGKDALRGDENV